MINLKNVLIIAWLLLCLLSLIGYINYGGGNGPRDEVESRTQFVMFMVVLTFPSAFLFISLIWVAEQLIPGYSAFGVNPKLFEVIIYWLGFVLFGYLQWFLFFPKLITYAKKIKVKQSNSK